MRGRLRTMKRLRVAIGAFAATVLPAVVFIATNRRRMEVAAAFLAHEVRAHAFPLVGFVAFLAVGILVYRSSSLGMLPKVVWRAASAGLTVAAVALVALVSIGAVRYVHWRYRTFSETAFQRRAMVLAQAQDLRGSHAVCAEYLRLYPGRRASGPYPDPVCSSSIRTAQEFAALRQYILAQPPQRAVQKVDGVLVPFGWVTRRRSLEILNSVAAGSGPRPPTPRSAHAER